MNFTQLNADTVLITSKPTLCDVKPLPTYKEVCDAMNDFINKQEHPDKRIYGEVFGWLAEYSQLNHVRMISIVSLLQKIPYDYYDKDFDVSTEDRAKIFKIGCDIHKQGGFTAQQASYYVATNFIARGDNKLKAIEGCWSGAGDWLY